MVIEFDGLLDEQRLRMAVTAIVDEVMVLGSRFVEAGSPYWERLPEIDPGAIVRIHRSDDTCRDLRKILAIPVDPATGPQLCAHLLHTRCRDTLCITVHHAAMDGRGLFACTRMIAESYRNRSTGAPPPAGTKDRSLSAVLSQFPEFNMYRDWSVPEDPPAGWTFPIAPGGSVVHDFSLRTLPPSCLDAVKRAGKLQGATVNDVLLAAYFLALCTVIKPPRDRPLPLLVSIDLRRYLDDSQPVSLTDMICNRSTSFPILLEPDTLSCSEMIARVRDAIRKGLALNTAVSLAAEFESYGYAGFDCICERERIMKAMYETRHTNFLLLGNTGIIPEEIVAFSPDLPVTNAFQAGIVLDPPGFGLGVTTFRNQLTLSVGYGSPAISHAAMEQFLDTFVGYLPGA